MLSYLYHGLESFRSEFSRERSWLLFCAVVISLMAAPEMIGVTSMCRYWLSGESGYNRLLHFFRSKAYRCQQLCERWQHWVVRQSALVEVEGRDVLLGDHTYAVKDGGRMPAVVSLRQLSETQSKPSYFRGQCWGALGVLVGSLGGCFCLPLQLQIHQGFRHLGFDESDSKPTAASMGERIVQMALAFAVTQDRPSWLVLDAFFSSAVVFRWARSVYSVGLRQPYLHILVRAKKNYVAYFAAEPKPASRPGQQARYGDKLKVLEVFDYPHLFHEVSAQVYGQTETVRLMSAALLWRPLGDWLQFIWAVTSRGPIVLMCSDLTLCPVKALELYCARTRIELMFSMLKHLIGAFRFRFWSAALPRHSRCPKPNRHLRVPDPKLISHIQACWHAYETFVLCASIALGLLQLIALRFQSQIWDQHTLYLRTRSRALPSEKTVKQVLAPQLARQLFIFPNNNLLAKIRRLLIAPDDDLFDFETRAA